MSSATKHGGARKGAGRKPAQQRMTRRSIGMFPSDWDKAKAMAVRDGVSVDEILRRLVRAS